MDVDELVEHWTLLDDERELLAGKRDATRLGFALLLKFYTRHGRFPRGRAELPDEAVSFVARQVKVPAAAIGFAQIRGHLGFRVCTVIDADKLTAWLAGSVAHGERRPDRVREELLAHCREEMIESPGAPPRPLHWWPRRSRSAGSGPGTARIESMCGSLLARTASTPTT